MDVTLRDLVFERGGFRLDIADLTFADGRTTAVVGPNGSGKSTLLRLIAGLERPASGAVLLGGSERAPRERRSLLAYAFQEAIFVAGPLRSNLDLALRLRGLPQEERRRRADDAAEACGIAHLLDRDAGRLSGGERQRANLARALCLAAPVTMLDEPMAGLDGPARAGLLHDLPGLLGAYASTTILVTHMRDEALRLADDLVVLIDGRLRAAGPKRDVFLAPPDAATAAFLGYAVMSFGNEVIAVRPDVLSPGRGDVCFELTVEAVIDLASHVEVAGDIRGTPVSIRWPGDPPAAGQRVPVRAPGDAVLRYSTDT